MKWKPEYGQKYICDPAPGQTWSYAGEAVYCDNVITVVRLMGHTLYHGKDGFDVVVLQGVQSEDMVMTEQLLRFWAIEIGPEIKALE